MPGAEVRAGPVDQSNGLSLMPGRNVEGIAEVHTCNHRTWSLEALELEPSLRYIPGQPGLHVESTCLIKKVGRLCSQRVTEWNGCWCHFLGLSQCLW